MRSPSTFLNRRDDLDVAMTPMIDVVFLLLVFFVWTASFQVVEYSMPANVAQTAGSDPSDPATPPPPEADFDPLVIRVKPGPIFELNGQQLSSSSLLQQRLATIASVRNQTPTVIHPDGQTPMGPAVDAYDAARAAGFTKVAFAVPATAP